jgi:hypothetical protein
MMRGPVVLLAAVVAVLAALPVRATVLAPADITELSREAAFIVRGTIVEITPRWADGRRRIDTVITLDVRQVLKGDAVSSVSFKVPGGEMGRYRSVMIGAPSFRVGEEVILFLGARAPALPHLLGLGQGVYRVERDGRTGEGRVTSPALFATARDAVVRRGDPARQSLTVEAFAGRVRAALAASQSDRGPAATRAGTERGR